MTDLLIDAMLIRFVCVLMSTTVNFVVDFDAVYSVKVTIAVSQIAESNPCVLHGKDKVQVCMMLYTAV